MFTVTLVWRTVLLVLESVQKTHLLKPMYKNAAAESTSGMFSRGSFFWINSQLLFGYRTVMSLDNLQNIDEKMSKDSRALQKRWQEGN